MAGHVTVSSLALQATPPPDLAILKGEWPHQPFSCSEDELLRQHACQGVAMAWTHSNTTNAATPLHLGSQPRIRLQCKLLGRECTIAIFILTNCLLAFRATVAGFCALQPAWLPAEDTTQSSLQTLNHWLSGATVLRLESTSQASQGVTQAAQTTSAAGQRSPDP